MKIAPESLLHQVQIQQFWKRGSQALVCQFLPNLYLKENAVPIWHYFFFNCAEMSWCRTVFFNWCRTVLFPLISPCRRSRNTHNRAFQIEFCRIDTRKISFFPRTVRDWNLLLPDIVELDTPEAFKARIVSL